MIYCFSSPLGDARKEDSPAGGAGGGGVRNLSAGSGTSPEETVSDTEPSPAELGSASSVGAPSHHLRVTCCAAADGPSGLWGHRLPGRQHAGACVELLDIAPQHRDGDTHATAVCAGVATHPQVSRTPIT